MPPIVSVLLASVFTWFRSRLSVQMELIALRHQVAVYQQSIPRPKLRLTDRLLWAWLSRLWPRWQQALAFVQPRTIIAWQKKRFRDHWRRLSQRGKPGRPAIAQEVRELIQDMWQSNPTWGSPRIVGEPIDVAYGVLYLASDESTCVTGSEFIIDGGATAAGQALRLPTRIHVSTEQPSESRSTGPAADSQRRRRLCHSVQCTRKCRTESSATRERTSRRLASAAGTLASSTWMSN